MKKGAKTKLLFIIFFQCAKCRCKIFCHVGLHLIHLHFYSLEMLYILLLNKERDLSFTLYLLQVLNLLSVLCRVCHVSPPHVSLFVLFPVLV